MRRSHGGALLAVALFAFYGCGGDDATGGGGSGAAGRAGAGGHGGSAGASVKGGAANNAGKGGTSAVAGRAGSATGGDGSLLDGGRGGSSTAGVGGTSSVAGGSGQAGGGQAGAEGGASPGTGGSTASAGEGGAGNGGEAGQKCAPGSELVSNGDFESGYLAFTTDYQLITAAQLNDVGQCIVAADASTAREGATDWAQFGDHTSGSGQMWICDGSVAADAGVWAQTFAIEPHERYELRFWFASVEANATYLPTFQPFADGVSIGQALPADASGAWTEYIGVYQAGDNTSVTLSIVDTNTEGAQNDFALDDVSFARTCAPALLRRMLNREY
jgi:hypothetical protein